jgi:DNA mismatch repair protein MutS2
LPYPRNIEDKLEFTQVREILSGFCLSEMGQQHLARVRFISSYDTLEKLLLQTEEFTDILASDQPFPADHYYNIQPYLRKAAIEGMFLQEEEFHQVRLMLHTFSRMLRYMDERIGRYPQLEQLFQGLTFVQHLVKDILRVIDEEGKIRSNASPELAKLSAQINEKEKEIRRRINKIFEKANELGWLSDTGITIRDGRLCLPVLAEHKRHIQGFVHDESNTGLTVFMEPSEVFDLNNHLRELQIAFRRERERILVELTSHLRPEIPQLEAYSDKMGLVDFIRAKALYAIELKASMPMLSKQPTLKWHNAYHPLLKLNHQRAGLPVVPLDIELNKDTQKRIVVISGPNAGGKSVCLKTVGLLQYMLQCGLLISCEAHSECGIFTDLMVDIGDEQSIENDLSTYSSHLLHMKHFTTFAGGKTLFLVDEFGTGTDPQFGGPLAEAILNALNNKGAFGVVTTHYSNLKNFAANTKGLENACMLFDHDKMQATYILELGKPGSSYAFEIAAKTGLSAAIIDYAKNKVGDKQKRVDDLLIELEKEKHHVRELKDRYEKRDAEQKMLVEKYAKLKDELDAKRGQLLKDARLEALSIVTEANSRIEQSIREIREKNAETEIIRGIKSELKQKTEELREQTKETLVPPTPVADAALPVVKGSSVKLEGQESVGEVIELKGNKALVAFGEMQSWVELKRLTGVRGKTETKKSAPKGIDMNEKLRTFSSELNLIATRGEDAVRQLQNYIDDAHLLGFKQVRIVHGKGYGILRKLVREQLKNNPMVEYIQDEQIELGGDGVTLVTLKM